MELYVVVIKPLLLFYQLFLDRSKDSNARHLPPLSYGHAGNNTTDAGTLTTEASGTGNTNTSEVTQPAVDNGSHSLPNHIN